MSAVRALVLLAPGAEEMEAVIAIDVLRRAEIEVVVAGVRGGDPVTCSRQVVICPDVPLAGVQGAFDAVVLPGGAEGAEALASSSAVGAILDEAVESDACIAAICAAPIALVRHGIGSGRRLTSHPSVRAEVEAHAGEYVEEAVVEDGAFVTSRGQGTAFAFALALVRRLCGDDVAAALPGPMMLD